MNRFWMTAFGAIAACAMQACSSDQSVNPGTPTADAGASLQVTYESQSVPVDLSKVPTVDYKGTQLVKLADVWTASQILTDRNTLAFEFVGDDGFKPSDKNGCNDLPGSTLDNGYIDPVSRKLTWDESLGLAGCYSVKGAAKMNAHVLDLDAAMATDSAQD